MLRATLLTGVPLAAAIAMPSVGRLAGMSALALIATATIIVLRSTGRTWVATTLAVLVGSVPTVAVLGLAADVLRVTSVVPLRVVLTVAWVAASLTLGAAVADRVAGRRVWLDVWARMLAALGVAGFIGGALGRLLLPSRGTDLRLAWMLGEEDNAAFVGVAREVLAHGPEGARLAEDFGAAFMNLPLALLRLAGGPLAGEDDVRLQAISLTLLSAVVAIALAGLAMALLASLPHHVHRSDARAERQPGAIGVAAGAGGTATAALAGFSLLAIMPLQTGFLTFLWGLSLVLIATAVVAVLPSRAGAGARLTLVVHLGAVGLLLLGSWPFILTALAPLALLPLLWIDRPALRRWRERNPGAWRASLAGIAATAIGAVWAVASLPQVSKVLELGMDVLTIGGSSIHADRPTVLSAIAMVLLTVVLLVLGRGRPGPVVLALIGPLAGAGTLMLAIRIATDLLVDGVMAYAGFKLLFGLVTLALVLGSLGLVSAAGRFNAVVGVLALMVVMTPHVLGGTATAYEGWWDRTERPGSMHAIATVAAIRASTPDVPIRCLPSPGTRIDGVTPWAAYFCIRWMEEGFNEGRFGGNAGRFLNAQGDDFGELVDSILAEQQSEYLFAYRMTMGPGWFGWTGP